MTASIGILTKSFAGDFDLFRILSETIDRHAPFDHLVVVPRRDLPLFKSFEGPRRRIVADEEFLPRWMVSAPMPGPAWRRRLRLPRRDVYLTPYSLPVRGWIAQQILKISAVCDAPWDVVLHVDSDAAFVRKPDPERLHRDGATRLYRVPDAARLPSHLPWHATAARLLGVGDTDYFGADYICNLTTWSSALTREMVARIEAVTGGDWRIALARSWAFSEYVLYGAFCDAVLGATAPVFRAERPLALTHWEGALAESEEAAFVDRLTPDELAIAVQSTIDMSIDRRAALISLCETRAAAQDASR